ncbi:MAG: hypothetical protein ACLFPQ_02055 [Candidatus Woesearchaeota archaeon]
MKDKIDELARHVRKMHAAINVYGDILHSTARSEGEKENQKLKIEIMKDEILHSNMDIKKLAKHLLARIDDV